MQPHAALAGRTILVVEDEPLIVMDIKLAFQDTGACVVAAFTMDEAMTMVERDDLAAAIVDYKLRGEDSSPVCERLKERGIPLVMYTGHREISGACEGEPQVKKPEPPSVLVQQITEMLGGRGRRPCLEG